MLSKSKISWTSPGFYQKPKTRCWFGVARTGVRRHQGHQTPKLESNTTAAVNVRFDCRLKFRVGVVKGSQDSFWWTRRRPLSFMRPQRALLLCRSIPTMICIVVLRWVEGLGLSLLTHPKLLTRLPDNHVSSKRQLTLNALQFIRIRCAARDWSRSRLTLLDWGMK